MKWKIYFKSQIKRIETANHYTCPTCLERNRNCVVLGEELIDILLSLGIYKYSVGERTESNSFWMSDIVCWECYARIKNIQLFRKRANYAQQLLYTMEEQIDASMALSRLKICDGRNTHIYNYNEDESTKLKKLNNTNEPVKPTNKITTKKKICLKAKDLTTIKSARKPVYILVNNKNSSDGKVIIKQVTSKNLKNSHRKLTVSEDNGSNIINTAENLTRDIDKFRSNTMKNIAICKNIRSVKPLPTDSLSEYDVINASTVIASSAEDLINQSNHVIGGERIIYDSDDGKIETIEEEYLDLDTTLDLTGPNVYKVSTQLEKDLTTEKEPGTKSSTQRNKELDNTLDDQYSILCYDSDNDSTVTLSSTASDFNEYVVEYNIDKVPPHKQKEQYVIEMMKKYIKNMKLNKHVENEVIKKPHASKELANKSDDDVIELSDDSDNGESDEYNDIDIEDQNVNKKNIDSNSKDNKHTQRTTIDRNESGDTIDIFDDYDSDKSDDYDIKLTNYVNQITAAQCIEKEKNNKDAEFEKNMSTNVTLDVVAENVSNTVVTSTSNKDQNDIAENKSNDNTDLTVENDISIDENLEENWLNKTLDSDTQSLHDSNNENLDSGEKNIPTCTENNFTKNKENEKVEKVKNIAVNYASKFRFPSNKGTIIGNKSIQHSLVICTNNVDTSTKKSLSYKSISTENDKTVPTASKNFKIASDNKTIVDAAKDEDNKDNESSKETVTGRYSSEEESEKHYSNRMITEDSTCCTGNELNGNRSNILLQPDDTLYQQNKDVNEEIIKVSKSTNATEFEEITCIPEETELNNVSKIQCADELNGQQQDINEETIQESKSNDASEVAKNLIPNKIEFNSVSKILPATKNQLNQQKENITEDSMQIPKSNCTTDKIELKNVTNRSDGVMTSKESDVNLTNEIRETPMRDICIQLSNNLVKMPTSICNKNNTETIKHIDLQMDKNLNDMLCIEKNITTKKDVEEYELKKETNAIAIRTVSHRQMLVVNRITSGAPSQVLKPIRQKSQGVNFENTLATNVINKIRIPADTDLGNLSQIHRKSIIPIATHKTITMPVITPELINPNEPELETTSETVTKISVTTEEKTDSVTETMCVPIMESEVIIPNERVCLTDYYLNMPLNERRERRLIKKRTSLPLKRSHKTDLYRYTDIERIWQEHGYAKLSYQRLKDTKRHFKDCMRYREKILQKQISEKSKSDIDSNGENSNDIHTRDDTMTDNQMSAKDCRKKVFNVLANMQTINLSQFFPSNDATMVNINDAINRGPIKSYKELDAHVTYETEEYLPCGEDTEIASNLFNTKQEPDSDISDYEHEDLEPYYACSGANKGIFCDEEINIKLEPMDLKSISTLSADEDNDFEDDTFYQQDFPPEIAFTDNDSNEDNIERPPNKPCDFDVKPEANLNVFTDKIETSSAFSDFDDDDEQELPILNQINNILSNLEADALEEELCADELLKPVYFICCNGETYDCIEEDITEEANKKLKTFSKTECSGVTESRLTGPTRNKKRKYSNSSRRKSNSSLQATKRKKKERAKNNKEAEKCEIGPLKKTKIKSRIQRKINKKLRNMSKDEIYRIILGEDIKKEYVEELNKTAQSTPKPEQVIEESKDNLTNIQNSLDDRKIALTDFIENNEVITMDEIEDMDEIGAEDDDDNITLNEFKTNLNKPESSTDSKENCVNESFIEKENSLLEDKSKEFVKIDMKNYLVQIPFDVIEGWSIAHSIDNALIPADFSSDSNDKITNAENLNQHKSNEEKSSSLINEFKDVQQKEEFKKKIHTRPVKIRRKRVLKKENPNEETTNNIKYLLKNSNLNKETNDNIKDISKNDNPNEETTDNIKDLSKNDNPNEGTTDNVKDLLKNDNPNEETTDNIKDLSKNDNSNEGTTNNVKDLLKNDNPNEETTDNIKNLSKNDNPNEGTTDNIKDLLKYDNRKENTTHKRKRIKKIDKPDENKRKRRSKTDDSGDKTSKEVKIRARKIDFKNHIKVVIDMQELELLREREKTSERFKNAGFKCESCIQIFPRCSLWKNHYIKYHCETNRHSCRICDSKFARKRMLMKHLEDHRRCFKCLYCDNKYFHLESLNEHLKQSNHGAAGRAEIKR